MMANEKNIKNYTNMGKGFHYHPKNNQNMVY